MEGMRIKRVRYISRSREEVSESLKRELKDIDELHIHDINIRDSRRIS